MKRHYITVFWATLIVSTALIVGSFFCPPMGIIDGSVLTAVGELFLWIALAFGAKALEEGKRTHIRKGDTDIIIGEDIDNNELIEDELK